MDVDQLIAAVFTKPLIWDKRMKEYANRNLVDKAWKEISKEMDSEGKFHFFNDLYLIGELACLCSKGETIKSTFI